MPPRHYKKDKKTGEWVPPTEKDLRNLKKKQKELLAQRNVENVDSPPVKREKKQPTAIQEGLQLILKCLWDIYVKFYHNVADGGEDIEIVFRPNGSGRIVINKK